MQQRIPRRETRKDGYKDKSRVLGVGCSIKLRVLGLSRGGVVRVTLGRVVRVSRGPTHSLSSSCELTAMCMHLNSSLLHNLSYDRASCSVLFCSREQLVGMTCWDVRLLSCCGRGGVKFRWLSFATPLSHWELATHWPGATTTPFLVPCPSRQNPLPSPPLHLVLVLVLVLVFLFVLSSLSS